MLIQTGIDDAFEGGADTDGDGIQDADEIDADGDGLNDNVDAGTMCSDNLFR